MGRKALARNLDRRRVYGIYCNRCERLLLRPSKNRSFILMRSTDLFRASDWKPANAYWEGDHSDSIVYCIKCKQSDVYVLTSRGQERIK